MPELTPEDADANEPAESEVTDQPLVKIAQFFTLDEAEIHAIALRSRGIDAKVFGGNSNLLNWFWQGFNWVDLHVPASDADRATKIIESVPTDNLEPAEIPEGTPAPLDEDGRPLLALAAFASVRDMRNAQTLLASAGIRILPPPLV